MLDSGEVHWPLLAAYLALDVRYELDALRTQLTEVMVFLNQNVTNFLVVLVYLTVLSCMHLCLELTRKM